MRYVAVLSVSKKIKIERIKVTPLVKYLEKLVKPKCSLYAVVGSFRRGKKKVGDLEILICGFTTDGAYNLLEKSKKVKILELLWKGSVKMGVTISFPGIKFLQLEVYVSKKGSWGGALLTRTGPKSMNIVMRKRARNRGYKLNEYGLWKEGKKVAGLTEKGIFDKLDLKYKTPEEREARFGR